MLRKPEPGIRFFTAICTAMALTPTVGHLAAGQVEVLGTQILPDIPFPEHLRFWFEDKWLESGQSDEALRSWYAERPPGCNVHVWYRSASGEPTRIEDLLLGGVSLKRALAFSDQRVKRRPASIYFAGLSREELKALEDSGEPVWWKAELAARGEIGEVILRLRRTPKGGHVSLELETDRGKAPATPSLLDAAPRMESISFAADARTIHLYVSRTTAAGTPKRVRMDGKLLPRDSWKCGEDPRVGVVPLVLKVNEPLARGSLHLFEVDLEDSSAAAAVRFFPEDGFPYGIWGGPPGKAPNARAAEAHVRDLHEHGINVQMPQVGSPMLADFYSSGAGQELCDSLGLRVLVSDPGKWGTRSPYAYFIHDEPDCGDYKISGLPPGRQIGSLAQWAASRSGELRGADPLAPQLLNVDMTFKPDNWYTYGPLPDIFSADPYYQVRLWETYGKHPERRPLYEQATFVYAVGEVCRAACAPRPLHLVLYACRRGGAAGRKGDQINAPSEAGVASRPAGGPRDDSQRAANAFHRFPTPQEKRMEVYYALAAGAKGLSYWWFTPGGGLSEGVGANDPAAKALWEEIGRLGEEVRIAGPELARSCPVRLDCKASPGVWVRTLMVGLDAVVLLIVNDQYRSTVDGTTLRLVQNTNVAVVLPAWMQPQGVFEVSAAGTREARYTASGREVKLSLGQLETTRMIVVTSDRELRKQLERSSQ